MDTHLTGIKPQSWLVVAGRPMKVGDPLNVPPISASNFILGGEHGYARHDGTPTWEALEDIVGGLEAGKAVAFASGMAAIAAVFDQLPVGAVVVLPEDCYQGVAGLASRGAEQGRWSVQHIAVDDTAGWVRACAIADLIWLETPSNPLLIVGDLETIGKAPRKPGSILAVDNTFATPLNQQPLDFGATFSVQSATKFIGGHSDLLAGVVTTRDEQRWAKLRTSRAINGATPGTLEAFLATRGARTLALRLERAQETAMMLAERLESHPLVGCVRYPGLPSHPTHLIAKRVLKGFGTIISFDLHGTAEFADAVCENTKLIRHATSLGSVESTMERRAALKGQEHLPPSLLRLSVGIEDPEDLWADLDLAIRKSALMTTNPAKQRTLRSENSVIRWLLDSDPSIRWQVMRDLTDAPAEEVAAERARVATEGVGARLLALQATDGRWGGAAWNRGWNSTMHVLMLLREMGLDPASDQARRAVSLVRDQVTWQGCGPPECEDNTFFEGEVEPCINGQVGAVGAYFGQDVRGIVDRLLAEQLPDGGWNCEAAQGSKRSSFNTTICVLEALLEYEQSFGSSSELIAARHRGQEYLLERQLFRRLSTGEVIERDRKDGNAWTRFAFPTWWHYDVLRGLDYLRCAGVPPDERVVQAIELVASKRDRNGRWALETRYPGVMPIEIDEGEGHPSRWITLRALRVLKWFSNGSTS